MDPIPLGDSDFEYETSSEEEDPEEDYDDGDGEVVQNEEEHLAYEREKRRQRRLVRLRMFCPPKSEDPGEFVLKVRLEERDDRECIIDAGASNNLMPTRLYNPNTYPPLDITGDRLRLTDGSVARTRGWLRDIRLEIHGLTILQDFLVLDCAGAEYGQPVPITLGRDFMMTAGVTLDGKTGRITVEIDGKRAQFGRDGSRLCASAEVKRAYPNQMYTSRGTPGPRPKLRFNTR